MCRVCRTILTSLILFAPFMPQMYLASTTDQPTSAMTTDSNVTQWTDPKTPPNLTLVIIEPTSLNVSFSLSRVLPAIDLAIEHINQRYYGIFHLAVVSAGGSCERDVVGVAAARISCNHNITVFVGPACSKAVETIAYMANDWNVPVITPVANTGDKALFPRLTRINSVMQSSFASTLFYLMKAYRWRHAALFYDKDFLSGVLLGETLTKSFKSNNYIWNSYELSSKTQNRRIYRGFLLDASSRSRVFIACMGSSVLRELLLEAYNLGYSTSGEFAFIIIQNMSSVATDETTWKMGNISDQMVKESLSQALFMHIDDTSVILPANFSREMRDRAKRDYNYDFGLSQPNTFLARYYDAVTIYATVVNETITEEGDPYDGLALTRRIWNRTFTGITGRVTVNKDGDRNSDVTITALNPTSQQFQKYAVFHPESNTLTFYSSKSFPWPRNKGSPPRDEPECGFTGILCTSTANSMVVGGLAGFFAVAAVVGGSVTLLMFRRWKKHSDKDLWWWKVDASDLTITDRKLVHSILSFTSKASLHGSAIDTESAGAKDGLLAVFKGQTVRLRSLPMKQAKFTKEVMMEFKMVRDLSHNNLVRIFGACFDDQIKALLIEHCNKGSLQDLLGNTNVTLDAQFKFSLCTDMINGLSYLHESPARCHGRLNSEVCLVDNRFSVKLADYALPSVYAQFLDDFGSQEYKTACLWKSPEVLRGGDRKGSREADIYSFGIILCEVVTRDCPYSSEILYLTTEEILEKVRQVTDPPFRPAVDVPVRLTGMKMLMEKCWTENPRERPSAQTVKTAIKKIASGKRRRGDYRLVRENMLNGHVSVGSLGETGSLLDNLMRRMELYANNLEKLVEDKTVELREEKKKSEELLYQILPRPVADRLKAGLKMEPESYECVTIYFSDIVGFTTISARSSPMQVVDLLNDVYSCFDAIAEELDVYKVETIGDAYMVVSGLPQRNGNMHAAHIARMSIKLLKAISEFKIRHMPDEKMRLRIGLHSGPVCAGVVGLKMPRYCLFGDTVNTASRMESHGEAMMIHMSASVKAILDQFGTFEITSRGQILIKGKGQMFTYWLNKENQPNKQE